MRRRPHRLGIDKQLLALAIVATTPLCAISVEATCSGDTEELKRRYLSCDREATTRRLSPGEVHTCSLVAEALLRYEFEGNFERLLSWWRA